MQLTTFAGADDGQPAWSPDGKTIAYLQGDEAAVLRLQPGQARRDSRRPAARRAILTESLDRAVSSPIWSADGKSIFVTVEDDRASTSARVPAAGGAVEPLTTGRRVVGRAVAGPGRQRSRCRRRRRREPYEVYAVEKGKLRKLTSQNDAWRREVAFAKVEDVTFTAQGRHDGQRPAVAARRRAGRQKLPLVLWIHGGPNGQDDHSFDDERELFAANGYAVLQVNYRGSSGRGSKYQKAIYADWGNLEVVDLLAGVDWAIKSGVADPERLGIGGWSYGGILTDYTIATDHALQGGELRRRQRAAALDVRVGPVHHAVRDRAGSAVEDPGPLDQGELSRSSTPIASRRRRSSWRAKRTSTCRWSAPSRCTRRFAATAWTTQLVIYPDQHHGVRVPSYMRDRFERRLAWFDKYLKAGATQPAPPPTGTKQ